jgi:ABC-2 type transport system permease protein
VPTGRQPSGRPPAERPSNPTRDVIATVQFLALPLTFLGAGFMDARLMPGWIQAVAHYNPFNWAVQAGRTALESNPDWGFVLARGGWLLALAAACGLLATMAFPAYQRSV